MSASSEPVEVRHFTDPACPETWAYEPVRRRLVVEYGESLQWRHVMGGLAREIHEPERRVVGWLRFAEQSGMPYDPLLWVEGAITSTYPACMAVKAAAEQGDEAEERYLRALREGLMCFRRKLDTSEALVEEARRAGLDVERFRIDLGSHAIVEAFGADLEITRDVPEGAGREDRIPFPSMHFKGTQADEWVFGSAPWEQVAAAAERCGAQRVDGPAPDVPAALRRFGRLADREVEAVCGLPGPRAAAELWRLAAEWQAKPVRVLTGWLWEPQA